MLEEGLHVDITINVEGGSVKAHRSVLASVSPVFNAMFDHPTVQLTSTVELREMSIRGLKLFLILIYLLPDRDGTVAMPEFATSSLDEHFDELIEACCKYQVKRLAPVLTVNLKSALKSALNPENCWDYLRKSEPLSGLCGIQDYKSSESGPYAVCQAYMFLNHDKVIAAESFDLEMQNDPVKVKKFLRTLTGPFAALKAFKTNTEKHSQQEKPSKQTLKGAKTYSDLFDSWLKIWAS